MISTLTKLETNLVSINEGLPQLPKNAKDWLVKFWPIFAIVTGVLQILAAWSLWRAGHLVNSLANYANELNRVYGGADVVPHLGMFYWLSLLLLVVDGAIMCAAYPALQSRRKAGWDLLLLGATINVGYGLVSLFDSSYGGFGKLLSTVVGSAIGYYFLFQLRPYYVAKAAKKAEHQKTSD